MPATSDTRSIWLQRPLPDGSLTVVAQKLLKWLPLLNGEPEAVCVASADVAVFALAFGDPAKPANHAAITH